MNKEFKEYFKLNYSGYYSNGAPKNCDFTDCEIEDAYKAGYESMQAKLDAKDKELEAFRGFADFIISKASEGILLGIPLNWVLLCGKTNGLIDENGKPTKLLTGDK